MHDLFVAFTFEIQITDDRCQAKLVRADHNTDQSKRKPVKRSGTGKTITKRSNQIEDKIPHKVYRNRSTMCYDIHVIRAVNILSCFGRCEKITRITFFICLPDGLQNGSDPEDLCTVCFLFSGH